MFLLFNSDIGYRNRHCWRNNFRMDESIPNDLTSSGTFRVMRRFRKRSGCWKASFIEYDLSSCWPHYIFVSCLWGY